MRLCVLSLLGCYRAAPPSSTTLPSHAALCSIPRRARSSSLYIASPLQLAVRRAPLLHAVSRPPHAPWCCLGAVAAIVPHHKVVTAVDAVAAVTHDFSKEMLQ